MNREELLTKLAMEMGEWPRDLPGPNLPGLWSCHHVWRCHASGDAKAIFAHEWVQRRAELINKPSWHDAPEWAEWLAQDEDGEWRWHECKPDIDDGDEEGVVYDSEGRIESQNIGATPAGHNWRDTLEQRPTFDESVKWTTKACTQCGHATSAKVDDDKPVCPACEVLGEDVPASPEPKPVRSKYHREIKTGVWVDVYDVLAAWAVDNPALQHLVKKALQPGGRGHKTREQDLDDIIASAMRAKELES